MVSDADLVTRLREILRSSDLDTATPGSVRRQLEKDFMVDLSDRKAFISEQIDIFLQTQQQETQSEGEDDREVEGEGNVKRESEEENDAVGEEQEEEEEESEDNDDEQTGGAKKVKKEVKRRGGFNKLCSLSPQLQKFVGTPQLPRTEVVKKVWAYIRENNLQDPKNKRNIICDESLHALFRVKSINMFQMNKALSKHIWPLSEGDGPSEETDNANEEEEEREEDKEGSEETEEEEASSVQGRKKEGPGKADKDVKKRGGGFTKLCSLSPQLQNFLGVPELARTEVVKRLWSYIREKNLQDPKNKRKIICDESLQALFHVNSIDMFQMNKALSKHIWPLDEKDGGPDDSAEKRKKQPKQQREEDADEPKQKLKKQKKAEERGKEQKKGATGLLAPLPLSDALVKFIGTGENALSRGDVIKRMWDYIKQNDLQDPSDKRRIICDDKLKELFEVDSFHGFSVSKLLTAHFIKNEQ